MSATFVPKKQGFARLDPTPWVLLFSRHFGTMVCLVPRYFEVESQPEGGDSMEVDLYAYCPCGSGKKIKFCKCRENIGELDKIAKMVDGGQMVAALDRLNQILAEHPDSAWAFAIRGRLLIRLREIDKLAENADRFLRLQPSNPLALLQRAAAELSRGDIPAVVNSVLESMSEARETHDSMLFEICAALGTVLAESGNLFSARAYLGMATMPEVPVAEMAMSALQELGVNRQISVYLKSLPDLMPDPEDSVWSERYSEAARLLEVNSVKLAESKFQAIDRQYPNQPVILASLLRCAIWRADQAVQAKLLARLADVPTFSEEDRDRFRAQSYLIEPGQPQLSVSATDLTWDVNELDSVLAALTAEGRTLPLPAEMTRDMVLSEDDVPPRAAFQLLDRPRPDSEGGLPNTGDVPEVIGMLLVYGRQTDRPARLVAINVLTQHVPAIGQVVATAMGPQAKDPQSGEQYPAYFANALQGTMPAIRLRGVTPAEMDRWSRTLLAERLPQRFMEMPLALLDGQTPQQASGNPQMQPRLRTLVRVLESHDLFTTDVPHAIDAIRQKLNVAALPEIDPPASGEMMKVPSYNLARVRTQALGVDDSMLMLERSRSTGCRSATRRFAEHVLGLALGEDRKQAKIGAYLALAESSADPIEGLEALDKAKQYAKANNLSNAVVLLSEIGFAIQAGDAPRLQRCVQSLTSEHGNNPNVMAQLQQLLVMYGLINPDGSARRGAGGPPPSAMGGPSPAPAAQSSGLWTPDSPAPASKPAGGSKLWVPGMD